MSLTLIRVVGVVVMLGFVALLYPVIRAGKRRVNRAFRVILYRGSGVAGGCDPRQFRGGPRSCNDGV